MVYYILIFVFCNLVTYATVSYVGGLTVTFVHYIPIIIIIIIIIIVMTFYKRIIQYELLPPKSILQMVFVRCDALGG